MEERLFGICVVDGQRFELTEATAGLVGTSQEQLYCSVKCRLKARADRQRNRSDGVTCQCCGEVFVFTAGSGKTNMCAACMTTAWLSCWGKWLRWEQRSQAIVKHGDGHALHPYECSICLGWHVSTRTTAGEEWRARCEKIGAHLRAMGYRNELRARWARYSGQPRENLT